MENVLIPPEFVQDPPAILQPEIAHLIGRDPERTPMQWDASPNAGFAPEGVTPWLPVAADYAQRNVAQQESDPTSMLNFFRALTRLRQAEPALNRGGYTAVDTDIEDIFAYQRTAASDFLIVLNFGSGRHTLNLAHIAGQAEIAIATDMNRGGSIALDNLTIQPNEGLVLQLTN
jgi:alpha-glucosidase